MLEFTGILVKHPEDGGKSGRNVVNFNIGKAYFISVHLLVYYISVMSWIYSPK